MKGQVREWVLSLSPVRNFDKMILRRTKRQGQSMIEFVTLIMFILATFIVFQKYIVRGISGRWKGVGDAIGQGRIYDPNKTLACSYDPQYTDRWFNRTCYDENCEGACLRGFTALSNCPNCIRTGGCSPACAAKIAVCRECITDCQTLFCD